MKRSIAETNSRILAIKGAYACHRIFSCVLAPNKHGTTGKLTFLLRMPSLF